MYYLHNVNGDGTIILKICERRRKVYMETSMLWTVGMILGVAGLDILTMVQIAIRVYSRFYKELKYLGEIDPRRITKLGLEFTQYAVVLIMQFIVSVLMYDTILDPRTEGSILSVFVGLLGMVAICLYMSRTTDAD